MARFKHSHWSALLSPARLSACNKANGNSWVLSQRTEVCSSLLIKKKKKQKKKQKKPTPEVSSFGKQLKIYNPVEICKGKNKKYNPNQPFRQPAN